MTTSTRTGLSALAVATAALLASAATGAGATPLNTSFGGANFVDTPISGTTSAARPELAGTVLVDTLQSYSFGSVSGEVQNRVVREDGTGTLDFYWRILPDPGTTDAGTITAFRIGNFGYADLTDADWRIDGLGAVAPTTARLFNPAVHPEGDINFLFDPALPSGGDGSMFFFLHTDATNFAYTAFYDFVGSGNDISGEFGTYAPSVPEPTPAVLLALGLMTLGWLRTRRVRHDA